MDERLPKRWMWTTLDDVVIPERIIAHPKESPTLPFIGLEHVEAETMRLIGTAPAHELKSTALHFWPSDVLYGRLRPYLNKILQPDFEGLCSAEFLVFRKSVNLSPSYLQYFLNSWDFKEFASHQITGDRPRVDWDQLKVFNFPLPPLPEQYRIVAAIEQQFTRLDSAVASLQSAKTRVKQYRASLLKAAVEGELTKEWRAEYSASETGAQLLARILDGRRARWEEEQLARMREKGITPKDEKWKQGYKEPQGPDVEQLPELPERWCWATVEQVSHFIRYGSSAKTSNDNAGIPVLRMGNIQDGRLDFNNLKYLPTSHPEFPALLLEKEDLLFNRTNSAELVGKSAVYRGEFSQCSYASYLICVRLLASNLADFLCFYINSHYGRVWINSVYTQQAGQANVNGSKLQALAFPLPPFEEIEQIVAEVEAKLSNMAKMEETIEISLKRSEHERQSILREAFAGRLVPQDPEDEPASILLERICEERKQREEAEKIVKVNRKGAQMEIAKRRRAGKASLYTTLVEARRPLPPDDLFKRVGLKVDEQPESVEVFYEELHADVEDALIAETRPDNAYVLLEALEPSAEVLARMAEAEAARQAQEAEQSGETVDAPTLWNM